MGNRKRPYNSRNMQSPQSHRSTQSPQNPRSTQSPQDPRTTQKNAGSKIGSIGGQSKTGLAITRPTELAPDSLVSFTPREHEYDGM